MNAVDLVLFVVQRMEEQRYTDFCHKQGMKTLFSVPCNGTAGKQILSRLGLQNTEKILILSLAEEEISARTVAESVNMGISLPGNGVAVRIPVESIGGTSSVNALVARSGNAKEEEKMEQQEVKTSLIIAIAENGNADLVMDAAREAGARGGTVVHAKGTAGSLAQKFFGVSLGVEKEMILIVTAARDRNAIMKSIMNKAGVNTPAHAVLFALPVVQAAGLSNID